jgi:hypothetical protein
VALGLGLVAEEEGEAVVIDHVLAEEAFAEEPVAVFEGDVAGIGGEVADEAAEHAGVVDDGMHAGGEEAGLEAGSAEADLLGEGDVLDGVHLLGVDGLVELDGVGFEFGDFVVLFEAEDVESGGSESVLDGVLGRAGFALGGTGSSGLGRVGAVGGELFFGYGFVGHMGSHLGNNMLEGWSLKLGVGKWLEGKGKFCGMGCERKAANWVAWGVGEFEGVTFDAETR